MRIDLATYVVARRALAEMMLANPSDEKYRTAYEALRVAFEQESEREIQSEVPSLVRLQAG